MGTRKKTKKEGSKKQAKLKVNTIPKYLFECIIFAFCFLIYANTLQHDYGFDDEYVTHKHPYVSQGLKGIPDILTNQYMQNDNFERTGGYRPITMLTFALEHQFFGANPQISHLINVILYGLACLILFFILKSIFAQYSPLFSLLITLLFAAYPLHTEVVASLKNREELLVFISGMAATWFFLQYYLHKSNNKNHLIIGVLCFIIALFCKLNAIVFAFTIPLTLYYFANLSLKKSMMWMAFLGSFMLLVAFAIFITADEPISTKIYYIENPLSEEKSIFNYLATVFYILGYYLKMLILPYPMMAYYGIGKINVVGWDNIWVWGSLLLHLALGVYCFLFFQKKQLFTFLGLYYLANISLYSSLFTPVPGIVADRFLFIPALVLCISLVYLLCKLFKANLSNTATLWTPPQLKVIGLVALLLMVYSYLTIDRNKDWKDTYTLLSKDIQYWDNAAVGQYLYANILMLQAQNTNSEVEKKKFAQQAILHYDKTLALFTGNVEAMRNIGHIYCKYFDNPEKGLPYLNLALKIDSLNFNTNYKMASCYRNSKQIAKALPHFEIYLKKRKEDIETRTKLVGDYCGTGNIAKAEEHANTIQQLKPETLESYMAQGTLHLCKSDTITANQYFEKAVQLNPQGLKNLARMVAGFYQKQGNIEKAQYYWQLSK